MAAPDSDFPAEGDVEHFTAHSIKNKITLAMYKQTVETSKLSPSLCPLLPSPDEPACRPSVDGEVAIYVRQVLRGGLRLPLSTEAQELCRYYGISPGQLTPNGWLVWNCFVMLCHKQRVPYSLDFFRYHYKIILKAGGSVGYSDVGYYAMKHRRGNSLVTRLPDNVRDWKSSWIFVSDPGDFPRNWSSRPLGDSDSKLDLSDEQLKLFSNAALSLGGASPYMEIFKSDADLYQAGLFPRFKTPVRPNWENYHADMPFEGTQSVEVEGPPQKKRKASPRTVVCPSRPKLKKTKKKTVSSLSTSTPKPSTSEASSPTSEQREVASSFPGPIREGIMNEPGEELAHELPVRELAHSPRQKVLGGRSHGELHRGHKRSRQEAGELPGDAAPEEAVEGLPNSTASWGSKEEALCAKWGIGEHVVFSKRDSDTVSRVCDHLYTPRADIACRSIGAVRAMERARAISLQNLNILTFAIREFKEWDERCNEKEDECCSLLYELHQMKSAREQQANKLKAAEAEVDRLAEELKEAKNRLKAVDSWQRKLETSRHDPGLDLEGSLASVESDLQPLFRQWPEVKNKYADISQRVKANMEEVRSFPQKAATVAVEAVLKYRASADFQRELESARKEGEQRQRVSAAYEDGMRAARLEQADRF